MGKYDKTATNIPIIIIFFLPILSDNHPKKTKNGVPNEDIEAGEIIQNIGELLYNNTEELIYRPTNSFKPVTVNVKDRKIVGEYTVQNFVIVDFKNKIIKTINKNNKELIKVMIDNNNEFLYKSSIGVSDWKSNAYISEDEISLISLSDKRYIPAAITTSLCLDSNLFLIYHEDKLLFVL